MSLCTYACTRSINQIRGPAGSSGQASRLLWRSDRRSLLLRRGEGRRPRSCFHRRLLQVVQATTRPGRFLCGPSQAQALRCEYSVVRPPSTLSLSSVSFNLRLPAGEREQRSGKEDQDVPCTVYEWGARGVLSSSARRRSCSAALDLPPRSVQELAVVDGSRQAAVHGAHLLDDGGLRSQGCRPRPGDLTGWDETSSLPSHNRTPPVPLLHQISPKFLARY